MGVRSNARPTARKTIASAYAMAFAVPQLQHCEEEPPYTVGINGYRVDKVLSVKKLVDELKGGASAK
jgi:hypothetical protein